MIAEAMARFFRQRRCSAAVGTSFLLLATFTFLTMHLLGLNSPGQQSLFHRPATKASENLPEMTSYQTSQPITTQDNGDELQVPIVSDLELVDAIHRPITLIADLPREYVPSVTNPLPASTPSSSSNGKRLVVIGDTHGRLATLQSLLKKISFNNSTDHLVLAGDLVTKGPDSPGLVQFAKDIGASAVRGNHDDHVLEAAKWLSRIKQGKKWWGKTHDEGDSMSEDEEEVSEKEEAKDEVDAERKRRKKKKPKGVKAEHIAVARSLSPSQLQWLASRPIILRVGHLPGAKTVPWNAKEVVVVHGGLIPSLPLEKQDPWAVMNMRSLAYELSSASSATGTDDKKKKTDDNINTTTHKRVTTIPLDTREGEPWSRAWNRYQNLVSNPYKRLAVIYGHDARSGLQVDKDITINLGKSPIPISRRQITGTGDQIVNVTAGGDVEIEIETEVEIESESEVEINVYSGGTVTTTTTTTTSTGTATQTITTGAAKSDDDDDDDDDPVTSTISTTTTTTVTKAPVTAAAAAGTAVETGTVTKRTPDGGNGMEAERSKKRPKKKFKGTRYAYGLDSGCGHGKQLTALVLEVDERGIDIVHRIEQVVCE
ncbi:Metallo-dependent phosphatase [Sordaria brevicollis]|uniref:Metallo-dependent phosphatase n=1 Tax=Sordaria brevicollis TaxID=83679 RepID=A0AAE0NWP9_SORBR|nr:Metallo-dependent phosphatase [Sordaria brevicollis]